MDASELRLPRPGHPRLAAVRAFESARFGRAKVVIDGARARLSDHAPVLLAEVTVEGAAREPTADTINQPPHLTRVVLCCPDDARQAAVRAVLHPA